MLNISNLYRTKITLDKTRTYVKLKVIIVVFSGFLPDKALKVLNLYCKSKGIYY